MRSGGSEPFGEPLDTLAWEIVVDRLDGQTTVPGQQDSCSAVYHSWIEADKLCFDGFLEARVVGWREGVGEFDGRREDHVIVVLKNWWLVCDKVIKVFLTSDVTFWSAGFPTTCFAEKSLVTRIERTSIHLPYPQHPHSHSTTRWLWILAKSVSPVSRSSAGTPSGATQWPVWPSGICLDRVLQILELFEPLEASRGRRARLSLQKLIFWIPKKKEFKKWTNLESAQES